MAARPTAERCRLEVFPQHQVMQARYGDMDVNGHLNNVALESFHEDIRARQTREMFPDAHHPTKRQFRVVAAQSIVHFLAEAHWPATITAAVGVSHIGRTSLVATTGLFIDGRCISICDTAIVLVGNDGPEVIPELNRQLLQSRLIGKPD
jgi:acyl-CoA thioester hydrolase